MLSTPNSYTEGYEVMTTMEAIQHFGGKKALARALDVWPHAIGRWGERPPMARQFELEVLTNGELKADRNDVIKRATA